MNKSRKCQENLIDQAVRAIEEGDKREFMAYYVANGGTYEVTVKKLARPAKRYDPPWVDLDELQRRFG